MRVTLSSNGAGVDGVTLNNFRRGEDFKKKLADREVYTFQHPYPGKEDLTRPLATTEVTIDDKPVSLAYDAWALQSSGPGDGSSDAGQPGGTATLKGEQAVFVATVVDGERPVLQVTKTFTLFAAGHGHQGVRVGRRPDGAEPDRQAGPGEAGDERPGLPPRESARTPDRQLMGGYTAAGGAGPVTFKSHTLDVVKAEAPAYDLTTQRRPAGPVGRGVERLLRRVRPVRRPGARWPRRRRRPTRSTRTSRPRTGRRSSPSRPPNSTWRPPASPATRAVVPMTAHFGPRWRQVLNEAYYAAPRGSTTRP